MLEKIIIKGAKVHNLKNIDCELPRNKLIVITGLSGSGKSSLAFDTIYAEGQRRYVESLSAYARQFLGQMEKPDVDLIEGLSPAVSIDQKTTSKNPRSTVGTITEIYDYLRLLYANIGIPHCPECGKVIAKQDITQIAEKILALKEGSKIQILAPVIRGRKGEFKKQLLDAQKNGFLKARLDGQIFDLGEEILTDKKKKHNLEIIIDRLVVKPENKKRIFESLESALKYGNGLALVVNDIKEMLFSQNFSCPDCDVNLPELTPRLFSFNNPYGACPECIGLGYKMEFSIDKVVPDQNLSLNQGAIHPWRTQMQGFRGQALKSLAKHFKFSLDKPFFALDEKIKNIILYGTKEKIDYNYRSKTSEGYWNYSGTWEGIMQNLNRLYQNTESEDRRKEIEKYMTLNKCPICLGKKLNKIAISITVNKLSIVDIADMAIDKLLEFFQGLKLGKTEAKIAKQIIKEILARLKFLNDVGLSYLTLSRQANTLSGGESQRIRLATQIGSGLVGVLYVLDEPSIGLHQKDNQKLLLALKHLRDIGNSLIVVEHDEDTIRSADHILDIGPKAGIHGGKIVAQGSLKQILKVKESITAQYLNGIKKIAIKEQKRLGNGKKITIKGAKANNLKNINVDFPLGKFIAITGLSGSGKSTLIHEILYKALAKKLYRSYENPLEHKSIDGVENIDKVIIIDQSPIGRTPRSNPATYTGVFSFIRELLAKTYEAKIRGYNAGRFSFNVKGGRCEACQGDGNLKIEMHFLPDVFVTCEVCKGKRYNQETLEVKYKAKNIADILDLTVEEGLALFKNIPQIANKLETLLSVGLGYIKLGQSSTTLSGGEAQRVKLATELSKRSTGRTLYILDEPTTGLHFDDVAMLLNVLNKLADAGNTIIVIEHNLDIIKNSDWVIDLGPEGGNKGGKIIAVGTPKAIANNPKSYTGNYLKNYL